MKYLPKINTPEPLRTMTMVELKELAQEIRQVILSTVATNGGHLASSLGTVELSIALHRVFNTPHDKLVWDVGHQAYPHKLLTGRYPRFASLRKEKGLSGFLRRDESEYDVFGAGHAGTSISAALGLAQARDIKGGSFKVVAIIGDGSMSCGLPFEGLNNAGSRETDLLVILNDNEMSISENVGALSKYFNWLVQSSLYNRTKAEAHHLVKRAPLGDRIIHLIRRIEESAKGLIVPSIFFEDLGFRYIGPVDGHNLDELIPTLQRVRSLKGPILLHAITRKGKGYDHAEDDATFWHSPPTFKVETGEYKKPSATTFTQVYGETLVELAREDPRVAAITAAMATGTGLVKFARTFPDRFIDVGIAEAHAVTAAAGMAAEGLRPFVTIYSGFMQRAFDSIAHDAALQKLPVILAMDRAGLVGSDGPTHHGLLDIAFCRIIPNMVVMAPKDDIELRDMMLTAKEYTAGPIAFRYPRAALSGQLPQRPPRMIPIGKAEVIRHTGGPVVILSYGHIYPNVVAATDILASEGVNPAIINARFAKPLDREMLLEAAARYPVMLSVEDGTAAGGFGSAVNEALVEMGLDAHCEIIGVPDINIEHGSQEYQHDLAGISPGKIAQRVMNAIDRAGCDTRTLPERVKQVML
ncbi:MAG: 1-deoxy-D-xylulose-5-phosphate synthase [Candidatus Sumerlaeota bacterium]|nr:1-deoxy-D-xylulose-5-phosphate synthase [Candidatus Sumerlaeota bacterium]